MNSKYGKLVDGKIVYAPKALEADEGIKVNPSKASYLAAGWKKIVDVRPVVDAGMPWKHIICSADSNARQQPRVRSIGKKLESMKKPENACTSGFVCGMRQTQFLTNHDTTEEGGINLYP